MLRQASIILPINDNQGESLGAVHNKLQTTLCKLFGGFTAVDSFGGWLSPEGKLYREPGKLYKVAMEPTTSNAAVLRDIARGLAQEADQECIFVEQANGEVEFVSQPAPVIPMRLAA